VGYNRSVQFCSLQSQRSKKGLVGADHFAQNPTLEKTNLVADVNLDMSIITYDVSDVVAFGAERSSVGPAVARAGATIGGQTCSRSRAGHLHAVGPLSLRRARYSVGVFGDRSGR